jgi:hypothetical protein
MLIFSVIDWLKNEAQMPRIRNISRGIAGVKGMPKEKRLGSVFYEHMIDECPDIFASIVFALDVRLNGKFSDLSELKGTTVSGCTAPPTKGTGFTFLGLVAKKTRRSFDWIAAL